MAKKRITELATETTLKDGQYVAIDHTTDGTKKLNIGAELTDLKEELEHITGISDDVKVALLQIASKVAYIDDDGQDYYDDLYDALYPPAELVSISSVYTQSGTVYATDSLDSLKSDLVVTATYDDATTATIASADYTLSGTLTEGTSTITVSYEEKTTTFDVVVTSRSLQRYLNINDIVETRGFSGISVSNLGNVTYNTVKTFSVFAIDPTLFPIRIQPYLSGVGTAYSIIFKEENGHYYGIDGSNNAFEFNYNDSVFLATGVTGITDVTKEGTTSRDEEFVATLENGELVLTYENGKVTISNANIFGFWASTTNIMLPEECEVNYGSV